MAWGGLWGVSPWGDGYGLYVPQSFSVVEAHATSIRSAVVSFSSYPLASGPIGAFDALNPKNWTVQNQSTGDYLTVLYIEQYSGMAVQMFFLEPFAAPVAEHVVTAAATMQSSAGEVIQSPRSAVFVGPTWQRVAPTAAEMVDLKNSAVPHSPAGVLVVGTDGDYELEEGKDLLLKLVTRRVMTQPGGFRHLPNYGAGLEEKRPYTPSDMIVLQTALERECAKEPELTNSQVSASLTADGVLTINLTATLQSGQTVSTALTLTGNQ